MTITKSYLAVPGAAPDGGVHLDSTVDAHWLKTRLFLHLWPLKLTQEIGDLICELLRTGISRPSLSRSQRSTRGRARDGATHSTQRCTQCLLAVPRPNFAVDTPRPEQAQRSPTSAPFRVEAVETLTAPTCQAITTSFTSKPNRILWKWSDRLVPWERQLSRVAGRWIAMVYQGHLP
jgi:hypothetical protein